MFDLSENVMEIKKDKENGVTVLRVIGQLTSPTSPLLAAVIDNVLKEENNLILDFEKLDYLASSGIRVLLVTQKKINATKGALVLRHVNDVVMDIFEMTGLNDFLTIEK